ncbi:MAG: hypothetical protein H6546_07805 [Chitinophagales bacterium]|nr:hypothetical protein [Chitinophagales bacterium]
MLRILFTVILFSFNYNKTQATQFYCKEVFSDALSNADVAFIGIPINKNLQLVWRNDGSANELYTFLILASYKGLDTKLSLLSVSTQWGDTYDLFNSYLVCGDTDQELASVIYSDPCSSKEFNRELLSLSEFLTRYTPISHPWPDSRMLAYTMNIEYPKHTPTEPEKSYLELYNKYQRLAKQENIYYHLNIWLFFGIVITLFLFAVYSINRI